MPDIAGTAAEWGAAIISTVGGPNGVWIIFGYYLAMTFGERLWYAVRRPGLYDVKDALNNFALNMMNGVADLVVGRLLPFVAYVYVYEHFRIGDLSGAALGLVVAFLVHELAYYWDHRIGHRVSLFWAFHQVHHSSNEFNYTVAARGCWFDGVFRKTFVLAAAVLGVSPVQFFAVEILKNMYGIFNHSRFIPKLGVLEAFVATPANHRVHHGTEPKYIDRNYGQVLVIWDRLFGTFQREEETPRFGLVKPYRGANPLATQVHGVRWLFDRINSAPRWIDKLRYLVGPPEWSHDGRCAECPKYRREALLPAE